MCTTVLVGYKILVSAPYAQVHTLVTFLTPSRPSHPHRLTTLTSCTSLAINHSCPYLYSPAGGSSNNKQPSPLSNQQHKPTTTTQIQSTHIQKIAIKKYRAHTIVDSTKAEALKKTNSTLVGLDWNSCPYMCSNTHTHIAAGLLIELGEGKQHKDENDGNILQTQ